MEQPSGEKSSLPLSPWDPVKVATPIDERTVRYSCGFLRSRPERWFPGFAMHWLPLGHSLGVEFSVLEVKPLLGPPRGLRYGFAGSVDDEPISVFIDEESARTIQDAVLPGAEELGRSTVLEYLVRRFFKSISLNWSGPDSPQILFEPQISPEEMREVGAVKVVLALSATPVVIWILIGKIMVERLDQLWKKQLYSTSRQGGVENSVLFEIGHLTVARSSVPDYIQSGRALDLEIPVSADVTTLREGRPWVVSKMRDFDGRFAFETVGMAPEGELPGPDYVRLSVCLGGGMLPAQRLSEITQPGAVFPSDIALTDRVSLSVQGEKIAEGRLMNYQGRLALVAE